MLTHGIVSCTYVPSAALTSVNSTSQEVHGSFHAAGYLLDGLFYHDEVLSSSSQEVAMAFHHGRRGAEAIAPMSRTSHASNLC